MSPAFDTTDRLTRNRKRAKKEDSQRKFIAEYVYFALKSGKMQRTVDIIEDNK
jgi:hypothetical protein